MNYDWTVEFKRLVEKAVRQYAAGARGAANLFDAKETGFLASIGCTAQEVYDFAEDKVNYQEPDFGTILLITAARRDYFLYVQQGKHSDKVVPTATLRAKTDEVDGIAWLPRIIQKARIKLAGELDADLMFGCGGDRAFLSKFDIHPADFLRFVWAAGSDDRKVIDWVKSQSR